MWLKFHWKDVNLQWDQREYGNVTDLRYPAGSVWQPDVLCYNSVDSEFDSTYKVNLVGIFTVSCKLDIYYWPWDEQLCFFKECLT
ncbi:acr-15 [Aphelenchoides avenae]|nr:acr-15 [Aphelenchus avenae]